MTPHEIIAKYPAPWQLHSFVVCLPLYDSFAIGAEAVVVTVFTRQGLRVELGYRALRIGDLTPAAPDTLVAVIADKIAHMIALHPGVVNLAKIPPWARAATAQALNAHIDRIRDAQTHLEWSAP